MSSSLSELAESLGVPDLQLEDIANVEDILIAHRVQRLPKHGDPLESGDELLSVLFWSKEHLLIIQKIGEEIAKDKDINSRAIHLSDIIMDRWRRNCQLAYLEFGKSAEVVKELRYVLWPAVTLPFSTLRAVNRRSTEHAAKLVYEKMSVTHEEIHTLELDTCDAIEWEMFFLMMGQPHVAVVATMLRDYAVELGQRYISKIHLRRTDLDSFQLLIEIERYDPEKALPPLQRRGEEKGEGEMQLTDAGRAPSDLRPSSQDELHSDESRPKKRQTPHDQMEFRPRKMPRLEEAGANDFQTPGSASVATAGSRQTMPSGQYDLSTLSMSGDSVAISFQHNKELPFMSSTSASLGPPYNLGPRSSMLVNSSDVASGGTLMDKASYNGGQGTMGEGSDQSWFMEFRGQVSMTPPYQSASLGQGMNQDSLAGYGNSFANSRSLSSLASNMDDEGTSAWASVQPPGSDQNTPATLTHTPATTNTPGNTVDNAIQPLVRTNDDPGSSHGPDLGNGLDVGVGVNPDDGGTSRPESVRPPGLGQNIPAFDAPATGNMLGNTEDSIWQLEQDPALQTTDDQLQDLVPGMSFEPEHNLEPGLGPQAPSSDQNAPAIDAPATENSPRNTQDMTYDLFANNQLEDPVDFSRMGDDFLKPELGLNPVDQS